VIVNWEYGVCFANIARHIQNCECVAGGWIWGGTIEFWRTVLRKKCATSKNKTFITLFNVTVGYFEAAASMGPSTVNKVSNDVHYTQTHTHTHTHTYIYIYIYKGKVLSGAESFVFKVAIQKFKDQDI